MATPNKNQKGYNEATSDEKLSIPERKLKKDKK